MGLTTFEVVFDNPWKVYYAGQTVSGNILLVLDGVKKIRGICVKVTGTANVSWTSSDDTTYTAHEEYFQTKYYLVGSASGSELEIQPGEHKFPFTCSLPANLPSSFESDYGHVRYTVKATLDRPWKFDQDVKAAFTVVSPFDLNQEPRTSEPIREEASKTFCCLCCATAPLTVTYSLPVRGYVPGQSMPIKINVENLSNVTVDRIGLSLCKVVTFHATVPQTETKIEEIVVTEISKGPFEGGAVVDYDQNLDIPALPPSNLNNCNIIDLEYCFKLEAYVSGWHHRNLRSSTPVFVGTVPLVNYQRPSAPPENMLADSPTKGPAGFQPPPTSNLYPELPPPSYEESTYGARNLRDRDESEHVIGLMNPFAPRYPVYHFTAAQ
ncbi:hypothetical protein KPH14_002178 [Odynerus spinipes]|uniref:Arrestin C-terminal-like domain-containing protein n=1 Tax=Odynerus spinipes TaxID=1348599 RepID=A0AAD9RM88_9HYME|nr:hypothetical protein KPH14_002178 [Odynerus spinipes]